MFRINPTCEEVNCHKAGNVGLVCTCTCTTGEANFNACGIVRIKRNARGDKCVVTTHYGIDNDGGTHALADEITGLTNKKELLPFYIRRRFQLH